MKQLWIAMIGLALSVATAAAQPAASQEIIRDVDAANRVADVRIAASSLPIGGGRTSDAERGMQIQLDRFAALANTLEAEIRAGGDRSETRALYARVKTEASRAIDQAALHGVALDPRGVTLFERMIVDLDRYYAQP